ncbi:hypothetical protein [Ancylobacter mangrovi]|uniref:Helix-turn-helix domain-containing protein n=1 Tax=Ancylobacter mangrovi TaxID=2972472 RepID=A0A9X2PB82_9HYPH|nr:hypothetical protein [Ancylobacter mangrovi]MCS0494194.1 hypothetical protein [Ancylobacter mangrovi]MCS0501077.1 hypothetical protein [Ancylobacter mangrovi]
MPVPAQSISPEALEEARRLYEGASLPLWAVASRLGVSRSTLHRRAKRWGWRRGNAYRPCAPPGQSAGSAPTSPELPRPVLIRRLVTRVENEIAAVERLIARAGLVEGGAAEAERAARTLAILVRSLRELAALEKDGPARDEDEAGLRDADAFRRELGETLERVLAGRAAG